jgi:hypothetical protein
MGHDDTSSPEHQDIAKLEVQAVMYKTQFAAAVERLEGNLGELFKHLESMAGHIVAFEAVLKEVVKTYPVSREAVLSEIRSRISTGTEAQGSPDVAVGVADRILS